MASNIPAPGSSGTPGMPRYIDPNDPTLVIQPSSLLVSGGILTTHGNWVFEMAQRVLHSYVLFNILIAFTVKDLLSAVEKAVGAFLKTADGIRCGFATLAATIRILQMQKVAMYLENTDADKFRSMDLRVVNMILNPWTGGPRRSQHPWTAYGLPWMVGEKLQEQLDSLLTPPTRAFHTLGEDEHGDVIISDYFSVISFLHIFTAVLYSGTKREARLLQEKTILALEYLKSVPVEALVYVACLIHEILYRMRWGNLPKGDDSNAQYIQFNDSQHKALYQQWYQAHLSILKRGGVAAERIKERCARIHMGILA